MTEVAERPYGHRQRRRLRLYAAPAGQPRTRRATDVLLLGAGLLGLVLLSAAYPPSGWEGAFARFLAGSPGWLDPVWAVLYDLLWLWALVLVLAALGCRRWVVALQGVGSLVLVALIALLVSRSALGSWPDLWGAAAGASDSPRFPAMRVAETAAVILVVSPHLVRSLRTACRWILVLGIFAGMFADTATPGANVAAYAAALMAAAIVRLAFGTSAGRPEASEVATALDELGVAVEGLAASPEQSAGVVRFSGHDASGTELLVKVYGRDAYDTQLLAKLWRTLWYRDQGSEVRLSRLQQVEHEALITLLAQRAGVGSRELVTAAEADGGDALLVLRGAATPIAELAPDQLDDGLLGAAWRTLGRLEAARVAHLQLDPSTVAIAGREVWLLDLGAATATPSADQLQTDRVQLLAATAAVAGADRAAAAAVQALGPDGTAALLPYLQSAALATPLRKTVRAAGVTIDDLRAKLVEATGAPAPEPVKLRRLTWWTVIQVALLVLAASAVFKGAASVDWAEMRSYLAAAAWGWVVLGFVVAQTPRVTQAVGMLGSVTAKLPFGPVYVKQLATSYLNLAVPSTAARMALSIRFFTQQGLPGSTAVTSSLIESLANNLIQALIIIVLLLFGTSSVDLNLSAPSGDSDAGHLLWILLGLLVVTVVVFTAVGPLRRGTVRRIHKWWPEARDSVTGLGSSHRLHLLILGNIATEVLFATALALMVRALGYHVPLTDVLIVNESVSLLSSFIPVPGGIGVVEFGLTAGLTSAGMPEEAALTAVLLYRIATFYLPPVWGFFAMRWLQRNHYL